MSKQNATGRWYFFWLRNSLLYLAFPGGAHQTAGLTFYNVKGVVSYDFLTYARKTLK